MSNRQNISLSGHSAKLDCPVFPADCKEIVAPTKDADQQLEQRFNAVVALLAGESVESVQEKSGLSRSSLYKFKARAVSALHEALRDRPKGTNAPHNRTDEPKEEIIKSTCERHPTLSSYQIAERLGEHASHPRTIQRLRKRLSLARLPKRDKPSFKAHRFTEKEKEIVREKVKSKLFLGGQRLAWDIRNEHGLEISPSTTKRVKHAILEEMHPKPAPVVWKFYERNHPHSLWHGDLFEKVTLTDEDRTAYQLTLLDDYSRAYVFCDLFREADMHMTIRGLIAAMRAHQTIPKAVLFDNGSYFKGSLVTSFCNNVGIRLIHSGVRHPQTNGKIERAFRDDKREFYDQYDEWIFDELKRNLPEYVHYRNHVRGHLGLGGKPSISRLQEQNWFALPSILEKLESYARHPLGSKTVGQDGTIHVLKREAHLHPQLKGAQLQLRNYLKTLNTNNMLWLQK